MANSDGTFFQGIQQRLSAPTLTFGDQPMANYRSGMIALPNSDVAAKLIATYFNKVSPSLLFLHIPSVEKWAADLLSDDGYMLQKNDLRNKNAVVLLVFASAQAYLSGSEVTGFDPRSVSHFLFLVHLLILSSTVCVTFNWQMIN